MQCCCYCWKNLTRSLKFNFQARCSPTAQFLCGVVLSLKYWCCLQTLFGKVSLGGSFCASNAPSLSWKVGRFCAQCWESLPYGLRCDQYFLDSGYQRLLHCKSLTFSSPDIAWTRDFLRQFFREASSLSSLERSRSVAGHQASPSGRPCFSFEPLTCLRSRTSLTVNWLCWGCCRFLLRKRLLRLLQKLKSPTMTAKEDRLNHFHPRLSVPGSDWLLRS